ncbi:MAG: hypothetical protein IJ092_06905 [Atopobiaceae bacterium]|nr:hypothetical protein [Atopobiaceae bacterium]
MARKVVKLGNRKRRYIDVVVPVQQAVTDGDGALVLGEDGEPTYVVEEHTYKVPLRSSLKTSELMLFYKEGGEPLDGFEATLAFQRFLGRYVPESVVSELDLDDVNAFFDAWDEASDEDGVTQGE